MQYLNTDRSDLNVWDRDVEELIHLGVPHHTDVGDHGCPKISLKKGGKLA